MIVVMTPRADEVEVQSVIEHLNRFGFDVHRSSGLERTVLGAIGVKPDFDHRSVAILPGVDVVHRITRSKASSGRVAVQAGPAGFGGGVTTVIAAVGPDVTLRAMLDRARLWRRVGVLLLKRRIDPQPGVGPSIAETVRALHEVGVACVVDFVESSRGGSGSVDESWGDADGVALSGSAEADSVVLDRVVRPGRVVLLRKPTGSLTDWLAAAEQVAQRGASPVFLVGGMTGDQSVDLQLVMELLSASTAPIVVDASGSRNDAHWAATALASIAAGADGVVAPDTPTDADDTDVRRRLSAVAAVASAVGRPVQPRAR